MKTMAEVLAEHWSASTHADSEPPVDKCDGCGAVLRTWGDDSDMPGQLAAHQSEALAAAGYGPVREAAAEALRDAAEDAEGMYDPIKPDCQEWADWLRVRADLVNS